jgi:hypothetical protein
MYCYPSLFFNGAEERLVWPTELSGERPKTALQYARARALTKGSSSLMFLLTEEVDQTQATGYSRAVVKPISIPQRRNDETCRILQCAPNIHTNSKINDL